MSTEEFIEKAKMVHGDKYDYSKTNYVTNKTKVCINCNIHGEFLQLPSEHLRGKGCKECGRISASKKQVPSLDSFIKKAKMVHGDKYDYSKAEYIHSHTKICIICPIHGEFWQTPNDHLCGKGCKKCGFDSVSSSKLKTTEQFIKDARKIHGDKYNYSKVEYNGCFDKVCIICPIHGEFWQTPNDHLCGKGCQVCRESKMEMLVESILEKNNIFFNRQKKFDWLGSQSLDFYLPEYKIGIECQGIQHYKPVSFGSKKYNGDEMLELNKERDIRKKTLCDENGIKIIYFSTEVCAFGTIKNENDLLKEIEKYVI
jgi:very-short-patch-repair endonuclease